MSESFVLPGPAGLEASYEKHLPTAKALDPGVVSRSRGDTLRARHNLYVGLANLEPYREVLRKKWSPERVTNLFADREIADASIYAGRRAEGVEHAQKTLASDVAHSYGLRDKLLSVLEVAVKFELLPPERVAAIRGGSGSLDTALDLVLSVGVFREFAGRLAGRTPVTAEFLEECQALGNSLQERLTPKGQKRTPSAADARDEAVDLARRFWTLTARKHGEARTAGREVFGKQFARFVPALQAVDAPRPKAPAAPRPEDVVLVVEPAEPAPVPVASGSRSESRD